MPDEYEEFRKHIGRKTVAHDVISVAQVQKLMATLNRDDPAPKLGDPVPNGWQHIFFAKYPPSNDLGPDGMAPEVEGGPGDPLPQRMYAGNDMRFFKPLRIGETARRETSLASLTPKEGRSGKLVFVTHRVEVYGEDGLVMEDDTNLVYREEDKEGRAAPPPGKPGPEDATWKREITVNPVMLFRFSATTFNPHRIHYDYPYTTGVEGYPGLLVHGPFTAIWLMELARENNPGATMTGFEMRAKAPLFANQPITLLGEPSGDGKACELWAVSHEGILAMEASASFA